MCMSPVVEFQNVTKRFGSVVAVDDFSLAVEKGQFVTLLGSSGSGKSTTLMMLAGFTPPDDGVIRIDGRDVTELPPHQRNIGLVYQNYALFPHMTVAQNVGFPLRMRRMSRDAIARLVSETLAKVRLGELGGRFPLQLSGGQQQRVALARALVFSPSILLMDEPLGALDKNLREEMQFEIKRIQGEARITTIYVTHDQEEAMSMSDHVVVMSKGRVEQAAPPSQLYERPQNIFVANFIGSANVVSGVIENRDGRPILRSENGAVLALADDQVATSGSRMAAVIRPERISFASADKAGAVPANIESVVYGGSIFRYIVRIGGERLDVLEVNRGHAPRQPGEAVFLSWEAADLLLIDAPPPAPPATAATSEGRTRQA
jgi:spermidine/putrescine ABC transporter ATP-binding subunit